MMAVRTPAARHQLRSVRWTWRLTGPFTSSVSLTSTSEPPGLLSARWYVPAMSWVSHGVWVQTVA